MPPGQADTDTEQPCFICDEVPSPSVSWLSSSVVGATACRCQRRRRSYLTCHWVRQDAAASGRFVPDGGKQSRRQSNEQIRHIRN